MRPILLRNKYRVFARHQDRLHAGPDPGRAQALFQDRFRRARRTQTVQTGFYALIYLSAIAAAFAVVARHGGTVSDWLGVSFLAAAVTPLAASASSLSVVGLVGLLLCRRYLGILEVDLFYFSLESTLPAAPPAPVHASTGAPGAQQRARGRRAARRPR